MKNLDEILKLAEQFEKSAKKGKKEDDVEGHQWRKMPPGWKAKSRKNFFKHLADNSVTECMKQMDDKMKNPGAFCASLKDRVKKTTKWRKGNPDNLKKKKSDLESQNLGLQAYAALATKISNDFLKYCKEPESLPELFKYKVSEREESPNVIMSARKAALYDLQPKGIVKVAFDTRRINQETEGNPRTNLQYWHRSDEFITQDQQKKIDIFAKLYSALENIKESYGSFKEWHDSYVRVLYDNVSRTLGIKQATPDIYGPQLSYLEQLLYARYRLSMEQIERSDLVSIAEILLNKDENLLKRGFFKSDIAKTSQKDIIAQPLQTIPEIHNHIIVDGNKSSNQDVLAALINDKLVRKDGERVIERTITIKIRDEAIE